MKRSALILFIVLTMCQYLSYGQVRISTEYPEAEVVGELSPLLDNTSSLFFWQDTLWSVNDHGGLRMYALDTLTGAIIGTRPMDVELPAFSDMEETAQDDDYFYFGDFGNNHEHLRDDLRVLRLSKAALLSGEYHFDTIFFTYEGYEGGEGRQGMLPTTEYDCESMIVGGDSLYLFTKQWTSFHTTCFALPKQPGRYVAQLRDTLDVEGLVTGACYLPERRVLVLCCYTVLCQPFVCLLYDFHGTDFFRGEMQRIPVVSSVGIQTEAIASKDGLHYFLTNENFSRMGISNPPQLLKMDLSEALSDYFSGDTAHAQVQPLDVSDIVFHISPNPVHDFLVINIGDGDGVLGWSVAVFDMSGKEVLRQGVAHLEHEVLDVKALPAGSYLVCLFSPQGKWACCTIVK